MSYEGGATYHEDKMPFLGKLGDVVFREETEKEVRLLVKFTGWIGGHYGSIDTITSDDEDMWNFWFDKETGECDEGNLKKFA